MFFTKYMERIRESYSNNFQISPEERWVYSNLSEIEKAVKQARREALFPKRDRNR